MLPPLLKASDGNTHGSDYQTDELLVKDRRAILPGHCGLSRFIGLGLPTQNLKILSLHSHLSGVIYVHCKLMSKFMPSTEGDPEIDEREKSRRMKISKANKGNVPWNKGKKHSPEMLAVNTPSVRDNMWEGNTESLMTR
ncbi:hypothetical protein Taro_020683 [Colocasia esculenta]|uniref:Nuclease associated modular domain-containing protein n=1 Tax=Colocasia esculenta TaxID=4460 RepID=A0A843V5X9_COLES|nr:hypothetical protein [Colocasia esculenta]